MPGRTPSRQEHYAEAAGRHRPRASGSGPGAGGFLSFLRLGGQRRAQDWVALVNAFARAVEARDPYTAGHLWRVATYAEQLATEMGGSPAQVSDAALGGLLHDIGKVAVPDAVLLKPGPLDPDEWRAMRSHPDRGADILRSCPPLGPLEPFVRDHHERLDGSGYPRGLRGGELVWQARLMAVADSFDAMTSARPYRGPRDPDAALGELSRDGGRTYDGEVVSALSRLAERGLVQEVVLHSGPGLPLVACPHHGPTIELGPGFREGDRVHCPLCPAELRIELRAGRPVAVTTADLAGLAQGGMR